MTATWLKNRMSRGALLTIALIAYFFGRDLLTLAPAGSEHSLTALWHEPLLREFIARGSRYWPLWWSAPATGIPLWAAGFGGHFLANPLILFAAKLSWPAFAIQLGLATQFLLTFVGSWLWLASPGVPSLVTVVGALAYAASPFLAGLAAEGHVSISALALALPWLTQAVKVLEKSPRDFRWRLVFLAASGYVALAGGLSALVVALIATLSLSSRGVASQALPARNIRAWFVSAFLIAAAVGGISVLPHLEFIARSSANPVARWMSPTLAPLGLIFPGGVHQAALVPYFSVLFVFLLYPLVFWPFSRTLRSFSKTLLVLACAGILFALVYRYIEDMAFSEACRRAGLIVLLIAALLAVNVTLHVIWHLLRSPANAQKRAALLLCGVSVCLLVAAAGLRLFAGDENSATSAWQNNYHVSPRVAAAQNVPVASSSEKLNRTEMGIPQKGAILESLPALILRQALFIAILAAMLYALSRGLSLRGASLALLALALVDLRSAADLTLPRRASMPSPSLISWFPTLGADNSSRILISPRVLEGLSAASTTGLNVVTYPAPRLPSEYAQAAERQPLITPSAPARTSQQSQLVSLAASGVRWLLLPSDVSLNVSLPHEQSPDARWCLYQLSPRPMRIQLWQRVVRVHDPVQALALMFNRDWLGDEVYVEGAFPPEWPQNRMKGSLGSAALLWDVGSDLCVTVNAPTPSLVVFSDAAYPGWKAWVDDKPAPLVRANGWMRAVFVAAGNSTIRMVYRPASVLFGGWLTCLGILVGVLAVFVPPRRRLPLSQS
jgi:hypothetical protein